jgi:hypothetical protein
VRADAAANKQDLIAMYRDRQVWVFDARIGALMRIPTPAELQKLIEAP